MTIFITLENASKIKESYLNLSHYALINVSDIFKEFNYSFEEYNLSQYSSEVVNNRILDLINRGIKIKRFIGIIYSNPKLNERNIDAIINKFESIEGITNVVFLDRDDKKNREFYKHFNEVSFYPSIKKITLIKAKKFDSKMFYWVNNMLDEDEDDENDIDPLTLLD